MKIFPLSLILLVTVLISGCAASKTDSSLNSPNVQNPALNQDKSNNSVSEDNLSETLSNDIALSADSTEDDQEQNIEIIYPNKAFATLKEPWTLKQFEENVANNHIIEWDFSDSDEANIGTILLYKTQKNNDGKVYLIAREHGDNCNLQAYLYLGIRDYKDDQLVVNFYQLGSVLVSSQCGTTYREMTDISMEPPNKVIYQEQTYLKIDISFTRSEELYCAPDDFYTYEYDENGDYILDENGEPKYEYTGCEAIYKDIHYKTTYLYKLDHP